MNIRKIDAGIHAFRIQKNSAASVTITDKDALPAEWKETSHARDRENCTALGKWFLETGELIRQVQTYAAARTSVSNERNAMRKPRTTRTLQEIAELSARGLSLSMIADEYNVSKQAIFSQIKRQRTQFQKLRAQARKDIKK